MKPLDLISKDKNGALYNFSGRHYGTERILLQCVSDEFGMLVLNEPFCVRHRSAAGCPVNARAGYTGVDGSDALDFQLVFRLADLRYNGMYPDQSEHVTATWAAR